MLDVGFTLSRYDISTFKEFRSIFILKLSGSHFSIWLSFLSLVRGEADIRLKRKPFNKEQFPV